MRAKVVVIILFYLQMNSPIVQGQQYGINKSENDIAVSNNRILFGKRANVFDFPFMVVLHIGYGICGGSIIGRQWVLTAGHCIVRMPCHYVRIRPVVWKNRRTIRASACYIHPNFFRHSYSDDIGLIKINDDFLRDPSIRVIPLPPPRSYYPPGTPATIVGYGQMENNAYPNILLRANLRIEDWNICNAKFRENDYECQADPRCAIPRTVLCTQGEGNRPPGTCLGDSGGPVIVRGTVAGVVSFLLKDGDYCKYGSPSMHTGVSHYIQWIKRIASSIKNDDNEIEADYEYYD